MPLNCICWIKNVLKLRNTGIWHISYTHSNLSMVTNQKHVYPKFAIVQETKKNCFYSAMLDYNIDLLKITTNNVFKYFYENITSSGFIPKITLPTRICDTASTLIDNVYTNAIDKSHVCGILIHPISDHQMYFCVLDKTYQKLKNKPKYIEFEKLNETSMSEFKHEIENAGLNHMLDNELSADPNFYYEILAKVLQSAKVKHIPKVTKKFNKRKHKRE